MPVEPVAIFVVERLPGRGYCVTASEGPQKQKLHEQALTLLDLLGHPSPYGPREVHAWLGPVGPAGKFVRVLIQRADTGELRYQQAWFAADQLPPRPARWQFSPATTVAAEPDEAWPDSTPLVLEAALQAADRGESHEVRVSTSVDSLALGAAITEVFPSALARRITWISHTEDDAVAVHVRLRGDDGLPAVMRLARLPPAPGSLRRVLPVKPPASSGPLPIPRAVTRRWQRLGFVLTLIFGLAAGWGLRGAVATRSPGPADAPPKRTPLTTPPPISRPNPAKKQIDNLLERVRSHRELLTRIREFLAQDGLAPPAQKASNDVQQAVKLRENLLFGTVPRKEENLTNLDVRDLLKVLEALDDLQKSAGLTEVRPDR